MDTSLPRGGYKQLKDIPDLICVYKNHTAFIEAKGQDGQPSEGQWEFRYELGPHLGPNVAHLFIYHPDQVPAWMLNLLPKEGE